MFSLIAVKRFVDTNKVRPFVVDKADLSDLHSPTSAVAAVSSASLSQSNLSHDPALARVLPQDMVPNAIFRRVIPRYENAVPVKNAAIGTATFAADAILSSGKKRDVQNKLCTN
jgi:hypothetical protein